jgi:hypothetical protein
MTGAVLLERVRGGAEGGTPRLLDEAEMKTLFNDHNNLLNAGVGAGCTMNYDRRQVVYTGGCPLRRLQCSYRKLRVCLLLYY